MSLAAKAHIRPGRAQGDSPCRARGIPLPRYCFAATVSQYKIKKQAKSGFWSSWIAARIWPLWKASCEGRDTDISREFYSLSDHGGRKYLLRRHGSLAPSSCMSSSQRTHSILAYSPRMTCCLHKLARSTPPTQSPLAHCCPREAMHLSQNTVNIFLVGKKVR